MDFNCDACDKTIEIESEKTSSKSLINVQD